MKKLFFYATMVAMVLAMPVQAQSRKDKKAAKKAEWEMRQQFIKDSTERANQAKLDAMDREDQARKEEAQRQEAERRAAEAEAKAKQKQAEEQAALQEVEFNEPCTEFESTVELIRARGIGEDLDHQFSVDLARTAALDNLASQVSTKLQGLLSRNRKQAKSGLSRASLQKAEDMVVTEVEQTTGYRIACKKTMTFTEKGARVFKTYMVLEVGASELLKPLYDGVQQDNELQLDMNFDEFKQEFADHFNNAQ